jgi:hypothetical protein
MCPTLKRVEGEKKFREGVRAWSPENRNDGL